MKYIYYQKNSFGQYTLRGSDDYPSSKAAEGRKLDIRQIVKIPDVMMAFSLRELEKFYPLTNDSEGIK